MNPTKPEQTSLNATHWKRIHSNTWDELPYDDDIINTGESLALNERQPLLDNNNVIFCLNIDEPINFDEIEDSESNEAIESENLDDQAPVVENDINIDDDAEENIVTDDEDLNSDTTSESGGDTGDDTFPLIDDDIIEDRDIINENEIRGDSDDSINDDEIISNHQNEINNNESLGNFEANDGNESSYDDMSTNRFVLNNPDDSLIERIDDLEDQVRSEIEQSKNLLNETIDQHASEENLSDEDDVEDGTCISRPKRSGAGNGVARLEPDFTSKSYGTKRHIQLLMLDDKSRQPDINDQSPYFHRLVNVIFTQMHATKGIKKHGQRAIEVLSKELLSSLTRDPWKGSM